MIPNYKDIVEMPFDAHKAKAALNFYDKKRDIFIQAVKVFGKDNTEMKNVTVKVRDKNKGKFVNSKNPITIDFEQVYYFEDVGHLLFLSKEYENLIFAKLNQANSDFEVVQEQKISIRVNKVNIVYSPERKEFVLADDASFSIFRFQRDIGYKFV